MVTEGTARQLVQSIVVSRLDYCNGLLCSIPDVLMDKLQKSQNTAARIVTCTRSPSHITPILRYLHWLPIRQRVDFKILLTVYKVLHGLAKSYIANLLLSYKPERQLHSSERGLLQENRTNLSMTGDSAFVDYAPSHITPILMEPR